MQISPLTNTDCRDSALLHRKVFFKGWTDLDLLQLIQDPLVFGLKIKEDNSFKGFILWREVLDECEILTFVISSDAQRRGLGTAVLSELYNRLRSNKVSQIFIEVAEDNQQAINFYLKHGFHYRGKRPHYYSRPNNKSVAALNYEKSI